MIRFLYLELNLILYVFGCHFIFFSTCAMCQSGFMDLISCIGQKRFVAHLMVTPYASYNKYGEKYSS